MRQRIDWDGVRAALERGCTLDDACRVHGAARATVLRKAKQQGWTLPHGSAGSSLTLPKRDMLARLFDALEKTMTDIERRLAEPADADAAGRERDARLLSSMAALYAKLKKIETDATQQPHAQLQEDLNADGHADRLRNALASRLNGLCAPEHG